MDKRNTWRAQEQLLVERWNAVNERYRAALAENQATEVAAAYAEVETVRRQVARLKVEFSTGKRY